MSRIPLYLKIKENQQPEGLLLFEVASDKSITYNDKNYDFTKIISNDDYSDLIEEPTTDSSCFIFMGPTGAGKTTTLKKVVYNKIKSLQDLKLVKFLTAFEVSGNRYIIDLLERKSNNRKEIQNAISIEAKLKKEKLQDNAGSIISAVFNRRNTRKTSYNDESSRSCLIITFFHNNKRVTYIDLMGNEKFDKSTPNSNIFANSSISAITQLLSKRVVNGRSSNFITNLIFRKDASQHKNINIILHLDQYGDSSLVKSTLVNIADLLKNFEFDDSFTQKKNPTSHLPNYAKPTVASLSPTRLGLRPSNRINSSPSKVKSISSISRQRKAPKSPVRQTGLKSPLRTTYLRSSPIKYQPFNEERIEAKNKENLIQDFHGIQVAGLKKAIEDLEYENSQLKKEHEEILEFFNQNSPDINTDLTMCKGNEEQDFDIAAMKVELEDLRKMNYETETFEQQKKFLIDRVDEFKIDFHRFKEEHGSFKDKVDNLKQTIVELEKSTSLLQQDNTTKDEKIFELTSNKAEMMKRNSELEVLIEESSAKMESLKDELSKIINSNKELLENHETLKMKYQELVAVQKENDLNKESNSELSQKLEEKDSLITKMEETISTKEEAILKASNEVKEIQMQLNELKTDADNKSQQVYNLESEIQERDTLIATIRQEIETLKSTLSEGNGYLEEKEIALKDADKKVASLENEVKRLEEENSKLSSSLEEQKQQFSEVTITVNELKHEISLMETKNIELQSQIEQKNIGINDATESNKELTQQIEEFESSNKDLKNSLSALKDDFKTMETKWNKKLEKKEKKQNNESTELQNKNSTLLNTITGLEEDIKNKESEWSAKLQEINTQKTEEINRLESKSRALEDKLNNVHLEMELKEKEWSKKLEKLENSKNETIKDLQTQLSNNVPVEPVEPEQNIESLNTMDFFSDQMSFPKFNPSNIFEDINTNMIDLPSQPAESVEDSLKENTPMEAAPKEKSPSKKKKALMPSNKSDKSENYKDKINFMSKDKKLKRKASSHKMKHKHHKSSPTKSQVA